VRGLSRGSGPDRPGRARPGHRRGRVRRADRAQRIGQVDAAARAGRAGPGGVRPALGGRARSRSRSRNHGWCRGRRVLANVTLGLRVADPQAGRAHRAGGGRAGRARLRLAADAVRRRGAAGLAGPGAGQRTAAAAARRAVQRAGRADQDHHAPAGARSCGRGISLRCCWSRTTWTRRSRSPTGFWSSATGGSPLLAGHRGQAAGPGPPRISSALRLLSELADRTRRPSRGNQLIS
jgi:hypothetical protein